jgi:hypothetical protein
MEKLSETMRDALVVNVTRSYGVDWSKGQVLVFCDRTTTKWALVDRGLAVSIPHTQTYKGRTWTVGHQVELTYEGIRIGVELANERGVKFPEQTHP